MVLKIGKETLQLGPNTHSTPQKGGDPFTPIPSPQLQQGGDANIPLTILGPDPANVRRRERNVIWYWVWSESTVKHSSGSLISICTSYSENPIRLRYPKVFPHGISNFPFSSKEKALETEINLTSNKTKLIYYNEMRTYISENLSHILTPHTTLTYTSMTMYHDTCNFAYLIPPSK